jgi:SAM-dependent methyltransferase
VDWHARYLQQAGWTRDLRRYLFQRTGVDKARNILEVGCGTGAVLKDLDIPAYIHGLDINMAALRECSINVPKAILTGGDVHHLPFQNQSFNLVFCHYFLLWVRNPDQAILEMKRVTVHGGHILVFAEPDYSKREDGPGDLQILGRWQTEALIHQGANPSLGATLTKIFADCGIEILEAGMIDKSNRTSEWNFQDWMMEWEVLENDLKDRVPVAKLNELKKLDEAAWQKRKRTLNIPTYFAWGRV